MTIFELHRKAASKQRDNGHFSKLQRGGGDSFAEGGEIVFVGSTDFFDESVFVEAFEEDGKLTSCLGRQDDLKLAVGKTADVELSVEEGARL